MLWLTILKLKLGRSDETRREAAKRLGQIGDASAVEPLIAALKDANEDARSSAITALGEIRDARGIEPLITALNEDYATRVITARALGQIGDARAVGPLIVALKDQFWWVRTVAADALAEIGDARAVEPLIMALKDIQTAEESRNAILKLLEKSRTDINERSLQAISMLKNVSHEIAYPTSRGLIIAGNEPLDCSHLIKLAREELSRRGIEPPAR